MMESLLLNTTHFTPDLILADIYLSETAATPSIVPPDHTMRVLYTFGLNEDGQCGVPVREEHNGRYFPIPVAFPLKVCISSVSAGSRHTLALSTAGEVFSWGWGHLGQLGHGDTRNLNAPTKISTLSKVTYISAGGVHSGCIDSDHYCYTWGSCTYGQLGLGKEVTETRKCIVSTPSIVTLRPDADVKGEHYYTCNDSEISPNTRCFPHTGLSEQQRNALRATKISCGGLHTAAIDLRGNVYCWGKADSGQTGYADWYQSFSAAVCSPRKVQGLGPRTREPSIASPQSSPRRKLEHARSSHRNHIEECPSGGFRAVDVSCGGFHTLVLMEDGWVYAMGKQDFGMLGTGTELSVSIDIGAEAPTLVKYGDKTHTSSAEGSPKVTRPISAVQISTGGWHSAIINSEGELLMCGKGEYGRLGLGNEKSRMCLTHVPLPATTGSTKLGAENAPERVEMVSAGGSHTVWATSDGRLFTVGRVDGGRLGIGYQVDSTAPPSKQDRVLNPIDITAALFGDEATKYTAKSASHDSGSDDSTDTDSEIKPNYKILQITAGGSHSAVLVEYPDVSDMFACDDFLRTVSARIQSEEDKVDPKLIHKVK